MLERLHKEIDLCEKCDLHKLKCNQITGENNCYGKLLTNYKVKNPGKKRILLIGTSPSYRRFDNQRRAFEGVSPSDNLKEIKTSGDFFFFCLEKSKLKNYDIIITNLIKCSTEGNEMPENTFITACRRLLEMEVNILKPDFIITMGNTARSHVLRFRLRNKTFYMYHPSYYFRFKSDESVDLAVKEMDKLADNIENDKSTLGGWC